VFGKIKDGDLKEFFGWGRQFGEERLLVGQNRSLPQGQRKCFHKKQLCFPLFPTGGKKPKKKLGGGSSQIREQGTSHVGPGQNPFGREEVFGSRKGGKTSPSFSPKMRLCPEIQCPGTGSFLEDPFPHPLWWGPPDEIQCGAFKTKLEPAPTRTGLSRPQLKTPKKPPPPQSSVHRENGRPQREK